LIEAMKLRAGLLLEREPEVYTFPHRTFQEYLAGAHLAAQAKFAQQASQLVVEGPLWREVILLAVGKLVYLSGDTDKPLALVGELCPGKSVNEELAWRKTWLAGEVLEEIGLNRVKDSTLGQDLLERVQHRLVDLLHEGALVPVERVAAGNTLARLGDPRFRVDAWYLPDEPMLGFVEIPEGPFLMGTDEGDERESPQHELFLPTYYISRYPVTVAQFEAFVKASGYKPRKMRSLRGLPNHPVVYVTWYDAIAYCGWLTETLKMWEGTPQPLGALLRKGKGGGPPWRIMLPSETEWEKAARGTDGRIYPWGNKPDSNCANYDDTGIGNTSAVSCFSSGVSLYGAGDLSGNVWEWTRSLWGKEWGKPDFNYPYDPTDGREDLDAPNDVLRVVRGGAFDDPDGYVRCAFRIRYSPLNWLNFIGFRVVASPISEL
jgi:formylglycine-generating enzyme required for sulfatase activity